MSQQKRTLGPWKWKWNYPCSKRITLLGPSQKIEDAVLDFDDGILRVNGERPCGEEIPPDLRLIAAAPELLEALKALVSDFGRDGYGGELEDGECRVIDMARAAIARATRGGK